MHNSFIIRNLKLSSLYLGNLFEHYDTALYTFLSPLFASLFFPNHDPITALILTFAIAPLAMIAKPFGSLFFGYIGDVKGRSSALNLSLWGMALVTVSVALIPPSKEVGNLSVLLLFLARALQNFFAAGENIGGAICFLESLDSEKERDFASSIYNTSSLVGILFASGLVALLYHIGCLEKGWRWLYAGGAVTAFFAGIIRTSFPIQSLPLKKEKSSIFHFFKRLKTFWQIRSTISVIALASGFSYATYSVIFSLMNALIPKITSISDKEMAKINTSLVVLDTLLLPVFGLLAKKFDRNKMMAASCLTASLTGIPLFSLFGKSSVTIQIAILVFFVIIGVWFSATFYSWSISLVPKDFRYSIISFSYSIGSQLLGGSAATISLWFYKQTGLISSAAWYWSLISLATFLVLYRKAAWTQIAAVKN